MTLAADTVTRTEVEDFLYREGRAARRLGPRRLAGAVHRRLPLRRALQRRPGRRADPRPRPDRRRRAAPALAGRAAQLPQGAPRVPHSNTSHQVTNVRLRDWDGDELPVAAEFTVWRFRGDRSSCFVGRYAYRLRRVDGALRIRSKRATLAMTTLRGVADVAIVL